MVHIIKSKWFTDSLLCDACTSETLHLQNYAYWYKTSTVITGLEYNALCHQL